MTRIKCWKMIPGSDESTVTVSVTLVTEVRRGEAGDMMLNIDRAMTSRSIDEALLRKLVGLPPTEDSGGVTP